MNPLYLPFFWTGVYIDKKQDWIAEIAQPLCLLLFFKLSLKAKPTIPGDGHAHLRETCKNTMKDDGDLEYDQSSGLHKSFHTGISLGYALETEAGGKTDDLELSLTAMILLLCAMLMGFSPNFIFLLVIHSS